MLTLPATQPPASGAIAAIHEGDVEALGRLLQDEPQLASARIVRPPGHALTLLHVATDWPGHFPRVAETIAMLVDAGADIEAPGAFDGVGGPLDNAVGFGQWHAARRLVERGAEVKLWHAAALGLEDRIEALFAASPPPGSDAVTEAFWQACHGGQRAAAEYLADRGADLNWVGYDDLTPLDTARRSGADDLATWVQARGGASAAEPGAQPPAG